MPESFKKQYLGFCGFLTFNGSLTYDDHVPNCISVLIFPPELLKGDTQFSIMQHYRSANSNNI